MSKYTEIVKKARTARAEGVHTVSQLMALKIMNEIDDNLILANFADALGVSTAAMTSMADKLEKSGLATRRHEPNDRRITYLLITSKGRKLINQIHP